MKKLPTYAIIFSSFVFKFLLLSILMIITNLPLIFSLNFVPTTEDNLMIVITLAVTIFPSLVAVNYALWEPLEKGEEIKLWKRFWKSYKLNWKKSYLYSSFFIGLFLLLVFDFQYVAFYYELQFLKYVVFVAIISLVMVFFMAGSLFSKYNLSFKELLKNSVYLTLSKFNLSVLGIFIVISLFVVTTSTHWGILQIFFWGLASFILSMVGKWKIQKFLLVSETEK